MLSAIAQPQALPHLCWDRFLPSNNNNPSFKQIKIHIATCLDLFVIFILLEGLKSTFIALLAPEPDSWSTGIQAS